MLHSDPAATIKIGGVRCLHSSLCKEPPAGAVFFFIFLSLLLSDFFFFNFFNVFEFIAAVCSIVRLVVRGETVCESDIIRQGFGIFLLLVGDGGVYA